MWVRAGVLAVCASVGLWGCGDPEVVQIFQDAPVIYDGDGDRVVESTLTLGQLINDRFVPLSENSSVPIINGFQGGTWVHLSIQAGGVPPDGLVFARLGDLSDVRYGLKLTRTPSGFLEAYDIPLPVRMSEEDLLALDGTEMEIEATFEPVGGEAVTSLMTVTLTRESE